MNTCPRMGERPETALQVATAWLKFLGLGLGLAALLVLGSRDMGYNWQWYRMPTYLLSWNHGHPAPGPLLQGLAVTLDITARSFLLAFAVGLLAALMRLSQSPVARWTARAYLEIIRNTPLLVQLFVIYFVFAPALGISAFASAVLSLSLFEGAYASEIFRAGILSVDEGQWEAARSLGMTRPQAYRHIILPQALRRILPPLTGQAVSLVKDSALASTIAVYELTMRGQEIVARTFLTFEVWFTVAAIYLVLTLALQAGADRLRMKMDNGTSAACR